MLTLKIKQNCCFDGLVSGKQKEVYEEKTPGNEMQFSNLWGKDSASWKNPQYVTFEIGEEPRKRTLVALCALALGEGYPEWGAEKGVVYFILKVQKIVEVLEPLEMVEEKTENDIGKTNKTITFGMKRFAEEVYEEITEETADEVVEEETAEEVAEEVSEEVETESEEVEAEQEQIEVQVLGECAIAAEQIEEEPLDVTMDSDGPVEEEADTMATETVGEELNEAESIDRERVSAD